MKLSYLVPFFVMSLIACGSADKPIKNNPNTPRNTDTTDDTTDDNTTEETGRWTCTETYATDADCDCGCGIADEACAGQGCTEAGCTDVTCDYCFDAEGGMIDCGGSDGGGGGETIEAPEGWTCNASFYADDDCDCGCGIDDPTCGGAGCSGPGCETEACEYCYDETGSMITCPSRVPPPPPEGWTCPAGYYSDTDCDCGCGIPDPTCGEGAGCSGPGCYEATCDWCTDAEGNSSYCGATEEEVPM